MPRLQDNPFLNEADSSSRWLVNEIRLLREKALRHRKRYYLNLDLDSGRLWETNASMSEQDLESASLNSHTLGGDVRIVDVEFAGKGRIGTGQAQITFYSEGYSDKVIIHLQDGDSYRSFLVEPFLARVKIMDNYVSFED